MKLYKSKRVFANFLIIFAYSCTINNTGYNKEIQNGKLNVQINDIDGSIFSTSINYHINIIYEDMRDLSIKVDGVLKSNYSDILDSSTVEIELENEEKLILRRSGNKIERISSSEFFLNIPIKSIEWDEGYSSIIFNYSNSETGTVYISGVNGNILKEYIGVIIAKALGGISCSKKYTLSLSSNSRWAVPAIIVGGYLGCVIMGTFACHEAAKAGCGQGNISNFKQVCGAGFNAFGEFIISTSNCSYICN